MSGKRDTLSGVVSDLTSWPNLQDLTNEAHHVFTNSSFDTILERTDRPSTSCTSRSFPTRLQLYWQQRDDRTQLFRRDEGMGLEPFTCLEPLIAPTIPRSYSSPRRSSTIHNSFIYLEAKSVK